MAEYISTHKACKLLGLSLPSSGQLTKLYKIRFIKDYNSKFWNKEDIQAILDKRERLSSPPEGWLTTPQAAEILRWSENCAVAFMKHAGLLPKKFVMFDGKRYRERICWDKREIKAILGEAYRKRKKIAPSGWMTFSDVQLYLNMQKENTKRYLKKYNPTRRSFDGHHFLYLEDDIVAMRKDINTKKQCRKNKLERTYSEKS